MSYGKPKLTLKVGDRVLVDRRNNGVYRAGEVTRDQPRISALCAGSIEWLVRADDGERWTSETLIKVSL